MAEFLSDAWIEELAADAANAKGWDAVEDELIVEQVVTGGPDREVRYRLSLGPNGARITSDAARTPSTSEPDLVLVTDYRTAQALHLGRLRAQDALAAGSLKVRGSPERLAKAAHALVVLDGCFTAARDRTTFPDEGAEGTRASER